MADEGDILSAQNKDDVTVKFLSPSHPPLLSLLYLLMSIFVLVAVCLLKRWGLVPRGGEACVLFRVGIDNLYNLSR